MKTNMGNTDRVLRILAAAVMIILYMKGIVTGTFGIVLMILAAVFALTSFVKFCPLYLPFGIKTNKIPEKK